MPLLESQIALPDVRRGKVRDVYPCTLDDGTDAILLVATDRISAFDVVMTNAVPGKGAILTAVSRFWFDRLGEAFGRGMPHHLLDAGLDRVSGLGADDRAQLEGRTLVCRRAETVPIECVVRGYLAGSGWKSYRQTGMVCGISLPPGLSKGEKLPEPIFTPTTKADAGHDQAISFEAAAERVGIDVMETLRKRSMMLYEFAHDFANQRGLILADTKFEFGRCGDELLLIDELLTPDSSRYWPASRYAPGGDQPSFDKQFVRDYLQGLIDDGDWDGTPPGPALPNEILAQTAAKYHEALDRLRS